MLATHQERNLSWSSFSLPRNTKTKEEIHEEMPAVFEEQPIEVDDYIRPDKTFFEKLEDWWDYLVSFLSPVDRQVDGMRWLHDSGPFGLFAINNWPLTFIAYGVILRLISLAPSLYAHRNALRLGAINGPLQEINNNVKRVKNDKTLSSDERKVVTDGYNRVKKALQQKHGCAQWKAGINVITAPLMMSAFMAVNRMTMYESDLEKASLLWVTDLTMPDPTMMLPLICAGSFVVNFELSQSLQQGSRTNTAIYIRWAMRVGVLAFTWYFSSQPAALFFYWLGTALGGSCQPLLLRSMAFRKYFDFPDPPSAGKVALSGIRPPNFIDRLTKSKEAVEEQARKHADAVKASAQTKVQHIDEFDISSMVAQVGEENLKNNNNNTTSSNSTAEAANQGATGDGARKRRKPRGF